MKKGYIVHENGGIECIDPREIKTQEGLIMDLMKSAGEVLLKGKGIVYISLPVRIFEPRSTIERVCDMWIAGPMYLKAAAESTDKVERFRNIVAFSISGLWNMGGQKKPFNPILGETY